MEIDANGTVLRNGRGGILVRVEDGLLVVDFGRQGVHRVEPEQTDFFEQDPSAGHVARIRRGGNFSMMMGRRFVTIDETGNLTAPNDSWHVGVDAFLLVFADIDFLENDSQIRELVRFHDSEVDTFGLTRVIVFPQMTDRSQTNEFMEACPPVYMVAPLYAEGYTDALDLVTKSQGYPQFAIIDPNGKLLARPESIQLEELSVINIQHD